MELVGILKESSYFANTIAVIITILVLAISIRCSFRTLFNIHIAEPTEAELTEEVPTMCDDTAGNDGDDEEDYGLNTSGSKHKV